VRCTFEPNPQVPTRGILARLALVPALVVGVTFAAGCGAPLPELGVAASSNLRLLVIAPHPDDESIAVGGLIQRVRSAGGVVHVVIMTSGDAFPRALETAEQISDPTPADFQWFGRVREQESARALAHLGVDSASVTFLGFPDEGMCLLASRYLTSRAPLVSPYTHRDLPPSEEQVIRGVEYRGSDVRMELARILTSFKPTVVVMPDGEDEHPDHCATYVFVRAAIERLARTNELPTPRVLRYIVHYDDWPTADSTTLLKPPDHFPEPRGHWRSLSLTDQEARVKREALSRYATQMAVTGDFMRAMARHNELFLQGDPVTRPECWCDSEHVATLVPPEQQRGTPEQRRHRRRVRR
jgi:LmbE family N-acetylglucosaminyl deacetylase